MILCLLGSRRVKVLGIKLREENKLKKFKSLWEGLVFPSKSFGDFKVIEYINNKHVVVQFVNTHNTAKYYSPSTNVAKRKSNQIMLLPSF